MEELFHALGIEPGIILVNMAGFVLLLALLKRFAFGPVGEILAVREREIEANLGDAERARDMALADQRRIDAELAKLDDRAREIVSVAENEAAGRRRELIARAEEQSRQIVDEGERAVEHATTEAREQLRRETAAIAVEVSERVLREALDAERQQALVDAFIADVERNAAVSDSGGERA
ncbi:MAG: F0F1 ATP synthase subunit B [candidate division WS1 bacterium]|jgi:F-type H+-transporting ATPase subunit b|nr:F0F1 ATP synthase subunit B [candidate division WS1 bacterium]